MGKRLKIGQKIIGKNHPCFIIAEAGVNHNGELDKALQLVDIAAGAGADAVKFQTFKAEDVVIKSGEMAQYQKNNLGKVISQLEMLRGLELKDSYWEPIIKRAREKNIIFMSTPHGGKASVDLLEHFEVEGYKVGSGDLNNFILLTYLAKTKKPIILSSGMATLKEVKKTVNFLRSKGNNKIAVLHCTTNYPCPVEEVNLLAMRTMMKQLDIPVGYSDHTEGVGVAVMAASLGACFYECHFTIDKSLPGPDHTASASPEELAERIRAIRKVPVILGNAKKIPTDSELQNMRLTVRKSLVASRDLPKGWRLGLDDLSAKRPGNGLSPDQVDKLLGKILKNPVQRDDQVLLKDVD